MTKIEELKNAVSIIGKYSHDPEILNALLEDDQFKDIIREAKWNYRFGDILEYVCETETIDGSDLEGVFERILIPTARAVLRSHNSLDENPDEWMEGGKLTILHQLELIVMLEQQLSMWKKELKSTINDKI